MRHVFLLLLGLAALFPEIALSEASISSSLIFRRSAQHETAYRPAAGADTGSATITLRFTEPPTLQQLDEIESHGVTFARDGSEILHTATIYPAAINLDSLELIAAIPGLVRIEDSARPLAATPLDVSNPLVQASQVWPLRHDNLPIDGTGVVIVNVDTGIDVFNPAFFKPDGGTFDWIDVNGNGSFDGGIDAVDLDGSGTADNGETLAFLDVFVTDAQQVLDEVNDAVFNAGVYDAGVEWLYNDTNGNGERDYGLDHGFTESSHCYGEQFFITNDTNGNARLDPGEQLTGLRTSKVLAVYTSSGIFIRGQNLIEAPGETQIHGTPAAGIVLGNTPGQRFVGMAPGAELISINRMELSQMIAEGEPRSVEAGIIWATNNYNARIVMHEFGSWVGEFLDGSSNYETMIREQVAAGINHFTASGNLAGPTRKKHAAFEISIEENKKTLGFSISADDKITQTIISILWRSQYLFVRPIVKLRLNDGSSRELSIKSSDIFTIGNYSMQSWLESSDPNGTLRHDLVLYTNQVGNYLSGDFFLDFTYPSTLVPQLTIDAYITDDQTSWAGGAQFVDYVTDDGTVTTPGTAFDDVTVGAYSPRGYRSRSPLDTPGAILDFSGWGRTIDGRIAVDITAPGYNVFSPRTFYSSGGNSWGYTDFNGTSAALPFVTGCAALILQAAPSISPAGLAQVIYDGAFVDMYVTDGFGDPPNDTWGYGKLHIYDSLIGSGLASPATIVEDHPSTFIVTSPYPNPFNATTRFDVTLPDDSYGSVECRIYNMLGQTVRELRSSSDHTSQHSFLWDGRDESGNTVSTGIYLFSITAGHMTQTTRAVFIK